VLLSLLSSALVLALLFSLLDDPERPFSFGRLRELLAAVPNEIYFAFLVLYIADTVLRTLRFRLLLRAGGEADPPAFSRILLVTGIRNMVVDLFPARLGELFYVGLMNRGYDVKLNTCLSSLAVSVWLDMVVLAPMLIVLVAIAGLQHETRTIALAAVLVLALLAIFGYVVLFHGLAWLRAPLDKSVASGGGRLTRWADTLLASLSDAMAHTRNWRVLGSGLLLSAGIRICKYVGLLLLFLAIARSAQNSVSHAEPLAVLAALVASEAAASLPIPAFMSFGTYEAGGVAAFSALGFPPADSAGIMFTIHVATQLLDYSLGLICLVLFLLTVGKTAMFSRR
jgi:uncharacterized membrane protein YbhN (UPF0104 family)